MNRRKFLKKSIVLTPQLAALLSLTGCAALDRYFEIEKSDYSNEVLIFGAGISGLSTAYFLKRNEVPYRVFEGSQRIGGRILSQRFPNPIGAVEMGAQFVDSLDQDICELIKEMNLELEEVSAHKNALFFCMNKEIVTYRSILTSYSAALKGWNKEMGRIRKYFDQLSQFSVADYAATELLSYDKISFADILSDSKLDFKGRFIFTNWAEIHFQKKIVEISYLEWLLYLEKFTFGGKKMRLVGGMSQFIDILGQRVSGVIPNYNMQVHSKLVEIHRSKDKWICHIQTKEGLKKLSSPFVVLALPFNQLKSIKGIENVFTNKSFKEALMKAQFKSHYRVVLRASQKSTKENGNYFFIESGRIQVSKDESVYTVDLDQPIDNGNLALIKNQMSQLFGVKDFEEINTYSWSQNPFIWGSELKISSNLLLPIRSAYGEDWRQMTLQLAGDYLFAPEHSNLNDCVRTAKEAAKNLTALVLEKELV